MDRYWIDKYPPGAPTAVSLDDAETLCSLTDAAISRGGDMPALSSSGTDMTFRELDVLADRFAGFLTGTLNLKQGSRIAIMLPNLLQFPVVLLGVLRAGMVCVNINPHYTASELRHQLADSGASVIVIGDATLSTLIEALPGTNVETVIATAHDDLLKRHQPAAALPPAGIRTVRLLDALAAREGFIRPPLTRHDLAFLQYTGGTTGVSKGAMLSHGNLVANCKQAMPLLTAMAGLPPGAAAVTPLPLYHIFALGVLFSLLEKGVRNVLVADPRDVPRLIQTLADTRPRFLMGINTLFAALMAHPAFDSVDWSNLSITVAGGAATQSKVAEEWWRRTGCSIQDGYGLTEASPTVSVNPANEHQFIGTVGLPVAAIDLRFIDEQGRDAGRGPGELLVRGPSVMLGYWNRPDETTKVLDEDGWLRTGDIARIDDDGQLYIVDRSKDMILVSGFNVFPSEVEEAIATHPDVAEVAVVGIDGGLAGEAVVAVVVRRDPALGGQEIIAHVRTLVAAYKAPREVIFVDTLPKSPVGKIMRRIVREDIAARKAS